MNIEDEIRQGILEEVGTDTSDLDATCTNHADVEPETLYRQAMAHRARKARRPTKLTWYLVSLVVGLCILLGLMGDYTQPQGGGNSVAERALSSGNGYDWDALSPKEKLTVGFLCEERTGSHDAWMYVNFFDTFYSVAMSNDPELLKKEISELAAVAAVLNLKD